MVKGGKVLILRISAFPGKHTQDSILNLLMKQGIYAGKRKNGRRRLVRLCRAAAVNACGGIGGSLVFAHVNKFLDEVLDPHIVSTSLEEVRQLILGSRYQGVTKKKPRTKQGQ